MKSSGLKFPTVILWSLVFSIGIFAAWGCSSQTKPENDTSMASWQSGMQTLAANLRELVPFVFSSRDFNSADQREKIQSLLAKFAKDVRVLPIHVGENLLGKDPIVQYSIERLEDNASLATKSFNEGHTEFARTVLRRSVGLCFNCHTTQNLGPQLDWLDNSLKSNLRISTVERSEYYVATRQFDKAIQALAADVNSPMTLMENPREQLDALRRYLYLQVRVKKDPGPAILLLDKYLSWEHLPYFMAEDAKSWMKSLRDWQNEQNPKGTSVKLAKVLIKKGSNAQQLGFNAGLVYDLRATSILHEQLKKDLSSLDKAEIYWLLGKSYDSLSDVGLWNLPELYFQACIRTAPGTKLARSCYIDFEKTIVLGFSGSSGVHIPKKDRDLLAELKSLAGFPPKPPVH